MIHNNELTDLDQMSFKSGSGLGYDGLKGGALIIEFDFQNNTNKQDPTYPHLSVQYTPKLSLDKYDQYQSSLHTYSLAHKALSEEQFQDESIHNIRVEYDPSGLDNINFKETPITRSPYLTRLLIEDKTDNLSSTEQWLTRFQMGLLKIYID